MTDQLKPLSGATYTEKEIAVLREQQKKLVEALEPFTKRVAHIIAEYKRAEEAALRAVAGRMLYPRLHGRLKADRASEKLCKEIALKLGTTQGKVEELEFRIAQAEPGSAGAIVNAVFDLAEKECGHNPSSAHHGLTTIRKWITDAKARINELEKCLRQVDDVLAVNWIVAKDNDYRKAIHDLIDFNIQIHDDPTVSEVAAKREARENKLVEALVAIIAISDRKHNAWDSAKEILREIGEGKS